MEECCATCALWTYTNYTENHYGMGVGVCQADGTPTFCGHHNCCIHIPKEDKKDETLS